MMPWLVDAVDEYTIENADWPESYVEKRKQPRIRELAIEIPESAVTNLFRTASVKGKVSP